MDKYSTGESVFIKPSSVYVTLRPHIE